MDCIFTIPEISLDWWWWNSQHRKDLNVIEKPIDNITQIIGTSPKNLELKIKKIFFTILSYFVWAWIIVSLYQKSASTDGDETVNKTSMSMKNLLITQLRLKELVLLERIKGRWNKFKTHFYSAKAKIWNSSWFDIKLCNVLYMI